MSRPDRRRLAAIALLLVVCAACGPAPTTPQPAATASLLLVATTGPIATPESSAAALPPVACLTLGEADCRRAAEAAMSALGGTAPAPVYLQVGPFGCRVGDGCARTLEARPEGDVIVEFTGIPAASLHLTAAGDGSIRAAAGETIGIIIAPSSAPLTRAGPVELTLGHCGLYSGIDADGSWWDPVGFVDIEHGDAINAAAGSLVFRDPTHATFISRGGLVVELLRRVGPKHLPLCD